KFRRRPKDSGARAASKQSSKADADLLIMLSPTPRPSQEAAMISFTVNGKQRQVDVPREMPLLWVLRESLNLTGTKYGCGIAVCGACTVHVDGTAVRSCVTPASAVAGRRVTTIEGLSARGDHPVQRAWTEVDVPRRGRAQTPGVFTPNQWLRIDRDGVVTITNSVPEMGQGSLTTTPMIIADELDATLDSVKVEQAPANPALYKNPVTGSQSYGGSRGVRDHLEMWRKAAASAREMLKQAAANEWGVPVESVETEDGAVIHRPTGRRFAYGQLVDKAQALAVPQNPKLKTPDQFKYIGKAVKRRDTPDKVTGRGIYGIDVQVP